MAEISYSTIVLSLGSDTQSLHNISSFLYTTSSGRGPRCSLSSITALLLLQAKGVDEFRPEGARAAGRSRRFSASGKAARARVCRAERIYALASVCLTWRTGEFPSRFLAAEPGYGRHFFRAEKSAPVRGLFLGRNNRGEAAYTTSPRILFSGAALACGVGSCVDGCPITRLIATTLQGGGDHASACARNEQASHANRECLIARLR